MIYCRNQDVYSQEFRIESEAAPAHIAILIHDTKKTYTKLIEKIQEYRIALELSKLVKKELKELLSLDNLHQDVANHLRKYSLKPDCLTRALGSAKILQLAADVEECIANPQRDHQKFIDEEINKADEQQLKVPDLINAAKITLNATLYLARHTTSMVGKVPVSFSTPKK